MGRGEGPAEGLSRRVALGLGLAALAAPALGAVPASAADAQAGVDAAAQAFVAGRIAPGVQVAIFRAGAPVLSRGYGLANLETGMPVDPTSIFQIGSVTKQFTAAQLLLLVEAGKLSVEDKLAKVFPDFPRASEISLRQILTHTAGLGDYANAKDLATLKRRSRVEYSSEELYDAMKQQTDPLFIAEPGTKRAYSNTGYVLLGLLIEKVAGAPYAKVMRDGVIARAGLTHTAFDDLSEVLPGRVCGYTPDANAPSGYDNAPDHSMTYPGGAGCLRSTCEDLCQWHRALLSGRVISEANLEQMLTPARLANGQIPTAKSTPGEGPPKLIEYGFGIGLGHDEHGAFIAHSGGIFGFLSELRTYRDGPVSIARIVNSDGGFESAKTNPYFKSLDAALTAAAFA
jgi:CubicO group peptidase (beta-lactamase class C family)